MAGADRFDIRSGDLLVTHLPDEISSRQLTQVHCVRSLQTLGRARAGGARSGVPEAGD